MRDGLPDIIWREVPAGTVTLEGDAGTFDVRPFRIAKYPVTYRQYKAFVDDPEGYRQRELWWQGLKHETKPGEQFRPIDNCPVDSVSWYDAMAFCRWLDARLHDRGELPIGRQVRLPTEWEWQQAATGGHFEYEYPWGPRWIEGRANTLETRLSRTIAVGMFPLGASPDARVFDLAGNVWEWCLNRLNEPEDISLEGEDRRAQRGGSFHDDHSYCRCGRRFDGHGIPALRSYFNGLRVCCAPPIPGI